jgi:hypothetical protein
MATEFQLQHNGATLLVLTFDDLHGEGRVLPRLVLTFQGQPWAHDTHVVLHRLTI